MSAVDVGQHTGVRVKYAKKERRKHVHVDVVVGDVLVGKLDGEQSTGACR